MIPLFDIRGEKGKFSAEVSHPDYPSIVGSVFIT